MAFAPSSLRERTKLIFRCSPPQWSSFKLHNAITAWPNICSSGPCSGAAPSMPGFLARRISLKSKFCQPCPLLENTRCSLCSNRTRFSCTQIPSPRSVLVSCASWGARKRQACWPRDSDVPRTAKQSGSGWPPGPKVLLYILVPRPAL